MIKAVNICGVPHDVAYAKNELGLNAEFGVINYQECKITINEDLPPKMMSQTLWHEILHGVLVGLGYSEIAQDETFVQGLASALNCTATINDIGCTAGVQVANLNF